MDALLLSSEYSGSGGSELMGWDGRDPGGDERRSSNSLTVAGQCPLLLITHTHTCAMGWSMGWLLRITHLHLTPLHLAGKEEVREEGTFSLTTAMML